jgi:hypothetical protein
MTTSDSNSHLADFGAAFSMNRFGAGRHILRDQRGWKTGDFQAKYIWVATIRPAFLRPFYLATLKTNDQYLCLGCAQNSDKRPILTRKPETFDLASDQVRETLQESRFDLFNGGMSLDGVSYSLALRAMSVEFDLEFSNPADEGLAALARSLWSMAVIFAQRFEVMTELVEYGRKYEYIDHVV